MGSQPGLTEERGCCWLYTAVGVTDMMRAIFTSDLWKSQGMSTKKDEGTWQKPMARKCPNRGLPPHLSQSKGCATSSLAHWHPRSAVEASDGEEAYLIFALYSWNKAWQVVSVPSTFVKKRIWVGLWKGRSLILRALSHLQHSSMEINIMNQKRKLAVLLPSMEPNSGIYMEQGKCASVWKQASLYPIL